MALHRVRHGYLPATMHAIQDRRGWARAWYVRGLMVGSWKSRNGKVYAVGHKADGTVVVYNPRVCVPRHGWDDLPLDAGEGEV